MVNVSRYKLKADSVLDNLRGQLSSRGANTIRGLSRVFKTIDSHNGNRKIDAQEFYVGLKELGLTVSKQDVDVCSIISRNLMCVGPHPRLRHRR